ncbi:MAG: hypothetical protein IKF90_22715 [Parasporobacterium sp.]|nr:hypothetical protein [Parasporobacterium sp.]
MENKYYPHLFQKGRIGKLTLKNRPIQTNGGRCHYGHAASASGTHDIFEVAMQMRGEADAHQIKKPIKHAMIRGFGGGQNLLCMILRYN